MRTLIAVVSIGNRSHLHSKSLPRILEYAARHKYNVAFITEAIQPEGKPPHYAKLRVPYFVPGFDRYCIIDDDLLLNPNAPVLPQIPTGYIGLARDHEQRNTTDPNVEWTGNTGFILLDKTAIPLLDMACEHGDESTVWGFADQGALNHIVWREKRVVEIDQRWNFAPVLSYFIDNPKVGWEKWNTNKLTRLNYFFNLLFNPWFVSNVKIRESWGIHLIRAQYNWIFNLKVPLS